MRTVRRSQRRLLRHLGLLSAVAIAAVACTGGGDDDDDAAPSPTPVLDADACQIAWINDASTGTAGLLEVWIVDVPIAEWTVGTHGYAVSGGVSATWYENYDVVGETWSRRAIATTGVFTLTAVSVTSGQLVRLVDAAPQPIWTIDTAGGLVANQGTSGTGLFEGSLSDPYSPNVTVGEGTVTIVIEGTSREIGQDLSYAVCYENAQLARPARTAHTLRNVRGARP